MTSGTESNSQRIQAGISRAYREKEALAILLSDLHAEQRKLAAVATIGALDDAQSSRLQAVGVEIAGKSARLDELDTAITGARDMLADALKAERAAVADAAWDGAAAKLVEAEQAAGDAYQALVTAGTRYADCVRLMREAYRQVTPHVRTAALPHLEPLNLREHFGMALKFCGGPDYGARVWHLDRCQAPPPLDQVVADHAARFLARRGEW